MAATPWTWLTYACAVVLALGVSYFLARGPFQVGDNLGNLLKLRHASLWEVTAREFQPGPYLRPFLWSTLKAIYDFSGGQYFAAFKAVHVLQVVATLILSARLLAVRTARDFQVAPAALVVIVGLHSFLGLVVEGFPVNTFLTIVLCTLVAANLSQSRGGWWIDLAACATLVVAALTVETGLLVWVVLVTAWLAGCRGVSARGVACASALVVGYFIVRFVVLGGGSPTLLERSTGYGFRVLEPDELQARFGAAPIWLYGYNVLASIATVLLSDPRRGVWLLARNVVGGEDVPAWLIINVATSAATSVLILTYTLARASRWIRLDIRASERMTVVFWGVLLANAVLSYPYTKDQIVTPAGVFYAFAAFAAFRWLLDAEARLAPPFRLVAALLVLVLASGWSVRAAGVAYGLTVAAWTHRNDWVSVPRNPTVTALTDPTDVDFVRRLRVQALDMRVPNPDFVYGRSQRFFDQQR